MSLERDRVVEPLCKFGPGGDFVAAWQPGLAQSFTMSNPLARLLASAAEMTAVVFGVRCSAFVQLADTSGPDELADGHTENVRNALEHRRSFGATDPPAAPVVKDGRRFSRESLLFPDVRRNGGRIEYKPKHRIRAYRRAAKKGSAQRLSKQSTLFEAQPGSVRIA